MHGVGPWARRGTRGGDARREAARRGVVAEERERWEGGDRECNGGRLGSGDGSETRREAARTIEHIVMLHYIRLRVPS